MQLWPRGLYGRLALSLGLILTLAMLSLGYMLIRDAEKRFDAERLRQVSDSAKILANGSLDALVSKDYELLEFWVKAVLVSDYSAYAYLSRADGRILTHTDPRLVAHASEALGELHVPLVRDLAYDSRPVREVVYPALLGKRHLANVHVGYYLDAATFAESIDPVKITAIILLFLVLMLLATLFIVRRSMRPVEQLTAVVNTHSLDTMSRQMPLDLVRRGDEISSLAHAFELMAESLLASFRDLKAEEALLQERVDERTRELEASNRELQAFTYSVSHDLRAPLRAIDGFSRALEEDCGELLDGEARDHLQRILRNTRRMSDIIDDLLRLSRVGSQELMMREVDLSALAQDIVAQLRQGEPDRAVEVHIQPGLKTRGDPRLLHILLENLLANAWKYTRHAPRPRIDFEADSGRGKDAQGQGFCVRDNGAGFDMAQAQKLYVAFQRLHSEQEFEGTGIGLTIVDRIIRRHAGWIQAEASPGAGACFCFGLEPSEPDCIDPAAPDERVTAGA